jgi:hypothetical protein
MTPEMLGLACVLNLAGFAPAGNWDIQGFAALAPEKASLTIA